MKDHLRFAIAYWHSFCGDGSDPFGNATRIYPWKDADNNDKQSEDLTLLLSSLQKWALVITVP